MSTVSTLADLKVGDAAVITGRGVRGGEEVTVVKVARVYVTVSQPGSSREQMFRIADGREKGDRGIGSPPVLRTREEYEATTRRVTAINRLRDLGLYVDLSREHRVTFTTETLEAILAAIPSTNLTEEKN